jgi:hypothetical protein
MEWIGTTISLIMLTALILAFVGMWNSNTDKMTDYDLYGMDADEYLKKQVGEEYYNKHYK